MKTIAVLVLMFVCLLDLSRANAQDTTRGTETIVGWFSDFGFQKLPEVVQWIRRLDAEWEKLVLDEQRAQILRQVKQIASTTAELELGCVKSVSLLHSGNDVIPEIETLEETVFQLRERMTRLSTDLGGDVGKDGLDIANNFESFMRARSGLLSEARQRLSANRPDDRAAAGDYLTKAAVLARNAHEAIVLFIKGHALRK